MSLHKFLCQYVQFVGGPLRNVAPSQVELFVYLLAPFVGKLSFRLCELREAISNIYGEDGEVYGFDEDELFSIFGKARDAAFGKFKSDCTGSIAFATEQAAASPAAGSTPQGFVNLVEAQACAAHSEMVQSFVASILGRMLVQAEKLNDIATSVDFSVFVQTWPPDRAGLWALTQAASAATFNAAYRQLEALSNVPGKIKSNMQKMKGFDPKLLSDFGTAWKPLWHQVSVRMAECMAISAACKPMDMMPENVTRSALVDAVKQALVPYPTISNFYGHLMDAMALYDDSDGEIAFPDRPLAFSPEEPPPAEELGASDQSAHSASSTAAATPAVAPAPLASLDDAVVQQLDTSEVQAAISIAEQKNLSGDAVEQLPMSCWQLLAGSSNAGANSSPVTPISPPQGFDNITPLKLKDVAAEDSFESAAKIPRVE